MSLILKFKFCWQPWLFVSLFSFLSEKFKVGLFQLQLPILGNSKRWCPCSFQNCWECQNWIILTFLTLHLFINCFWGSFKFDPSFEISFLTLLDLCKCNIRYCTEFSFHFWVCTPNCYLDILDQQQKQNIGTVGSTFPTSRELFAHRRIELEIFFYNLLKGLLVMLIVFVVLDLTAMILSLVFFLISPEADVRNIFPWLMT